MTIMHSLPPDQIAQMVDFSDAKALFTDKTLWAELKDQTLPRIKHVISLEDWQILLGKEIAIENRESKIESDALRHHVLRTVNPQLPLYSQLYDVEITDTPLAKTEKQTIKRYLYK